jgi:hypothetical protein
MNAMISEKKDKQIKDILNKMEKEDALQFLEIYSENDNERSMEFLKEQYNVDAVDDPLKFLIELVDCIIRYFEI